jgi:hypothetical protein
VLRLPAAPVSHELPRGEPADDGEHERHDIRPVRVVREDDLREHDADGEADERTDDPGHDGHPGSVAPTRVTRKRGTTLVSCPSYPRSRVCAHSWHPF